MIRLPARHPLGLPVYVSSCSNMAISSSKAVVRSWSRAAAFTRNFTPLAITHHEQRQGGSTCER